MANMMRRAAAAMRAWPGAMRWLAAELIPIACVAIALLLIRAGAAPVGFILGIFGGIPLTMWYLNWVEDAHPLWCLPLIAVMLPAVYLGMLIVHPGTSSDGNPIVITAAYREAFGGLLVAVAVTVALAVVNGERHRGRYSYLVVTRSSLVNRAP